MRRTRLTGVVTYSCIPSGNSMTTTEPLRGARTSRPATALAPLPSLRNTTSTKLNLASSAPASTGVSAQGQVYRGFANSAAERASGRNLSESARKDNVVTRVTTPLPRAQLRPRLVAMDSPDSPFEPHRPSWPHAQGWIEVVCGSMFSGKTEELL